jgi:hypothetical protein
MAIEHYKTIIPCLPEKQPIGNQAVAPRPPDAKLSFVIVKAYDRHHQQNFRRRQNAMAVTKSPNSTFLYCRNSFW